MFERYTEKARRAVFFARYEASQFGSPTIESEHLLLGLLRENKHLYQWIPNTNAETIRQWINADTPLREKTATSIDLPLSRDCKKILTIASDEADALKHRHIGTEHLFLALLSVPDSTAAKVLTKAGADLSKMRSKLAQQPESEGGSLQNRILERVRQHVWTNVPIEIHGVSRKTDLVRDLVNVIRSRNWHWQKAQWKAQDLVFHRKSGKFSLNLSLAEDAENFILGQKGWTTDHCFICGWELFESDNEHGVGYTNGRDWLCLECCERFVLHDFFSSSQSEIT